MLGRGLLRRCPWCGDRRAYFRRWFFKFERCQGCQLAWRRGDIGFELGPIVISTIITFGAIIVGIAGGFILFAPEVAVVPLTLVILGAAIIIPVVTYPITYTIWQASDLAMRPLEETGDHPSPQRPNGA